MAYRRVRTLSHMQPVKAAKHSLAQTKSVSMQLAIIESVENLHAMRNNKDKKSDSIGTASQILDHENVGEKLMRRVKELGKSLSRDVEN